MTNATIRKFGYPESLVARYDHWLVLLRPAQPTLGALVLAARSDATALGELCDQAFAEQAQVVRSIERALGRLCNPDRLNLLMLMMVDPHVHFHVIPRYAGSREWDGVEFVDHGWPALPDLKQAVVLDQGQLARLAEDLRRAFGADKDQSASL